MLMDFSWFAGELSVTVQVRPAHGGGAIVQHFDSKESKSQGWSRERMQYVKYDLETYRQAMRTFIGDGPETKVFWNALDFAIEAHGEQWRRSGDPYIMHPCSVAKILAEELDIHDPEILAAALLHDTVEDVEEVTGEVIREKFGPNVEAIVVPARMSYVLLGNSFLGRFQMRRENDLLRLERRH